MKVPIHPLTTDPTAAWQELSKNQRVIKVNVPSFSGPPASDKVRFVCMSDTHSLTPHIKFTIPDGDVFLHAGDFTKCGAEEEVIEFNKWLGKLPHKHKVVIAGNHELSFDSAFSQHFTCENRKAGSSVLSPKSIAKENSKRFLTNCTYLQDEAVTICGIKIYGTPWQPEFCNWAFNLPRGNACLEKWDKIPEDTDVLLSHSPPVGHGDLACTGVRAGCVELLTTVQQRVRPKYHVFGHIHEGYGITTDGSIIYVNAATCNINYRPVNPPIVFDVSLPPGYSKD